MNKKVFTAKDDGGNEVELAIIKSSPKQQVDAQLEYAKAWRLAENSGSILRRDVETIAKNHGIWNDEKVAEIESLEKNVLDLEKKLRGGANSFSDLNSAKDAALEIRKLRNKRNSLLRERLELDSVSCENFADIARTNYLISQTVVYNSDGKKYFRDVSEFIDKSNSSLAVQAAIAYYELNTGDIEDSYENTFLKKYKFIDEKNRLVNKDGHLVTDDGKLINENGNYVNEKEELVDIEGNRVDQKGQYLIEFKEW